jgi:hypothetical protein
VGGEFLGAPLAPLELASSFTFKSFSVSAVLLEGSADIRGDDALTRDAVDFSHLEAVVSRGDASGCFRQWPTSKGYSQLQHDEMYDEMYDEMPSSLAP